MLSWTNKILELNFKLLCVLQLRHHHIYTLHERQLDKNKRRTKAKEFKDQGNIFIRRGCILYMEQEKHDKSIEVPEPLLVGVSRGVSSRSLSQARRLYCSTAGLQENDILLTSGQIPQAGHTDSLSTTLSPLLKKNFVLSCEVWSITRN